MTQAESTVYAFDPYILKHLGAWLEDQIRGDTRRELVQAAMLELVADDPEYWSAQGWWNVYERAKCDRIPLYPDMIDALGVQS